MIHKKIIDLFNKELLNFKMFVPNIQQVTWIFCNKSTSNCFQEIC